MQREAVILQNMCLLETFQATETDFLTFLFSIPGHLKGQRQYNATCQTNPLDILKPRPFQEVMLNIDMPGGATTKGSDDVRLTFMHVIHNAYVTWTGNIFANGK